MTRAFAAVLVTHLLLAACPARPSMGSWCPPSADSLAGWWSGRAGEYGQPPGIELRRDGTIAFVHGGGRGRPYRWSYSPATCQLAISLGLLDSASVAAYRHEEGLHEGIRLDSAAGRVVLMLSRNPPSFFFNGSDFQRP